MKRTYETPTLAKSGQVVGTTRVSGSSGPETNKEPFAAGSVGFAL
jgi:hypothetical protein